MCHFSDASLEAGIGTPNTWVASVQRGWRRERKGEVRKKKREMQG